VRSAHARCCEALERGLAAVRPGVCAGDLDALVREGLDYPHHTGHGVGTAAHEEPRIVPASQTVLEPGMIVALEPGSYPGPWGMRVERVALVTEGGCEVLSAHDLSL
jgi:Xaa-Pro aminopeptidase